MGIVNGLKGFGIGLAADVLSGGLTMGFGKMAGLFYGLFKPDSQGLLQAHDPGRFEQQPKKDGKPVGLLESLFNHPDRLGGQNRGLWMGMGFAAIATTLFSGIAPFSLPALASGLFDSFAGGVIPLIHSVLPAGAWNWVAPAII